MTGYQRILFPTDLSDTSADTLQYAADFARKFGAKLDVIHVLTPYDADPANAEPELAKLGTETCADVIATRDIVRAPRAELGVLREARQRNADLIIIGTHGRSGLKHVLLGSVAERVVQLADRPVLTVRPQGWTFERP